MFAEAMCLSIACVTSFNTDLHEAVDTDFEQTEVVKFKFKSPKRDLSLRALRKQLRKYDLKWKLKAKRNTTIIIDLNDPEDVEIEVKHKF